jgi:tetratricopeptide (TPR) repeat protein
MLILGLSSCALSPEAKRDKYLASGKKLIEKRDYRRAILDFKNGLRVKPRDAELYYQLGIAYLGTQDVGEGAMCLRKALELNPKHVGAQLALAQLMASASNPNLLEEANKRLAALLLDSPDNPDALSALALTDIKLGRAQDGMAHLSHLLEKDPRQLTASVLLAQTMWAQRDLTGAEEVLKRACEKDPAAAAPRIALGSFYASLNRFPDAEQQFRRALGLAPQNLAAESNLAMLLSQLGRNQDAEALFRSLATSGEGNYRSLLGIFLFEQGRRDEGLREFERITKADPDDRQARTRLVAAYRSVNRTPDAERVLSAALKKNPTDLDALLQRSELYIAAKEFVQAETDLNQVLHYRPNSGEAHFVLSRIRQLQGSVLTQRQELGEALRLSPYLVAVRLELAQLLLEAKDGRGAIALLDAAPIAQKNYPVLIVQRNWALWTVNNMAEFRKGVDQGLALERSPDLLIQDGMWKLQAGNYAGARTSLEEALKLNPGDLRAIDVIRHSYIAQNQPVQAIQKVKEYAGNAARSAPVQQFLGNLLMVNGETKEARSALVAANSDDPNYLPAYFSLAQLDITERRWDDAAGRLQKILSLNSGNTTARLWLAHVEETKGKHDQAMQHYGAVVAADPGNAEALNNLAFLKSEFAKQPDEALKYAQKAKELQPGNASFSDTLGWILYRKGLYPSAVTELERAAATPGDPVWKYHLAIAYAKAGDFPRGRATLRAALKQNPNLPEAKMAQEILGDTK